MKSKLNIKRIKGSAIFACVLFSAVMGGLTAKSYSDYKKTAEELELKQRAMDSLVKEIETTKIAIERFRKEREEFSKFLFAERDVPTFLDGISSFAAKSSVYVVDMKTQGFQQVNIPDTVLSTRADLALLAQRNAERKEQQQAKKEDMANTLTLAAMPIRIKISGAFESLVDFLVHLEGYEQLLTLTDVGIVTTSDYPKLSCEFTLKIYSLKTLAELKP